MARRIAITFAIAVLAVAAVPQLVQAAAGVFTSGSASTSAVKGTNTAAGGKGVEGAETATSGTSYGVYGSTKSNAGIGVYGQNTSTSGTGFAWGLKGQTSAPNGRGLEGYASNTGTALHTGVVGVANGGGTNTTGVFGWAKGLGTAETNGVWGQADSDNGTGVYGYATHGGWGGVGVGGTGLLGIGGFGVEGYSGPTSAIGNGSYGVISDTDLGVTGHLIAGSSNLAGVCGFLLNAPTTGTSCTFNNPFPNAGGSPFVVVTAQGDPGGYLYVSGFTQDGNTDYSGFVVTRSAGTTAVTIAFHVIGIDATIAPASRVHIAHQARYARFER